METIPVTIDRDETRGEEADTPPVSATVVTLPLRERAIHTLSVTNWTHAEGEEGIVRAKPAERFWRRRAS